MFGTGEGEEAVWYRCEILFKHLNTNWIFQWVQLIETLCVLHGYLMYKRLFVLTTLVKLAAYLPACLSRFCAKFPHDSRYETHKKNWFVLIYVRNRNKTEIADIHNVKILIVILLLLHRMSQVCVYFEHLQRLKVKS